MPKKQVTVPKFRSEAAEAKWWDSHPEAATEIMKRAVKSGNARRAGPLKAVTMRLPVLDIKAAQDLAQEKGLPYQTYNEQNVGRFCQNTGLFGRDRKMKGWGYPITRTRNLYPFTRSIG